MANNNLDFKQMIELERFNLEQQKLQLEREKFEEDKLNNQRLHERSLEGLALEKRKITVTLVLGVLGFIGTVVVVMVKLIQFPFSAGRRSLEILVSSRAANKNSAYFYSA